MVVSGQAVSEDASAVFNQDPAVPVPDSLRSAVKVVRQARVGTTTSQRDLVESWTLSLAGTGAGDTSRDTSRVVAVVRGMLLAIG